MGERDAITNLHDKKEGKGCIVSYAHNGISYVSCIGGVTNGSWHDEVSKSMDLEWRWTGTHLERYCVLYVGVEASGPGLAHLDRNP